MTQRYTYLTGEYVAAMQLEEIPVQMQRNAGVVSIDLSHTLPLPGTSGYERGVQLDGALYVREPGWPSYVLWRR